LGIALLIKIIPKDILGRVQGRSETLKEKNENWVAAIIIVLIGYWLFT